MVARDDKSLSALAQVEVYLARMRHTLPFPCSAEECYYGCVPEIVKGWRGQDGRVGRNTNLLLAMSYAYSGAIIHVSVEDEQLYIDAKMSKRGHEKVFWFRAHNVVPCPLDSKRKPLFLPYDHPNRGAIIEWAAQALDIEDEIDRARNALRQYFGLIHTPTQIRNTWPELMNVVKFKRNYTGSLSNNVARSLRNKVDLAVNPEQREAISIQIARASMLEKPSKHLESWVKFHTPEFEI